MAYPYPIDATADLHVGGSGNCALGPYLNGTNRYVLMIDDSAQNIRVYKSTDLGVTWARQDAGASEPVIQAPGSNYQNLGSVQVGTVIYISFYDQASGTPRTMAVARFDMSTDEWLSKWVWVGVGDGPVARTSASLNGAGRAYSAIFYRPDNTFLVVYQGGDRSGSGSVVSDAIFAFEITSGGDFGVHFDVQIGENGSSTSTTRVDFDLESAVMLSSGVVVVIMQRGVYNFPSATVHTLRVVAINLDKSTTPASANYLITTDMSQSQNVGRVGQARIMGTEVWVPFVRLAPGAFRLWVAKASTSNLNSWSFDQVSTTSAMYSWFIQSGQVEPLSATVAVAMWWATDEKIYRAVYSGGAWGASELVYDSTGAAFEIWGMALVALTATRYAAITAVNTEGLDDPSTDAPGLYFELEIGETPSLPGRIRAWVSP